ncbi:MAG: biosynthetic-type acetolactate synthase large subunit [Ruminococcaceae bacterium]|nr:biosynthetic-type acetolactate synthase large subunit [Oscillospiraceae bacterium]
MKIAGSDILVETLIEQGAEVVFGYPGGQVLNIYDSLYLKSDRIKHIITAHEQGAAHAADGYARATGKVGVVIATSGPGATNLVTGLANAMLDSVPMVAITGNVPCNLLGKDSFQEVDIVGVTIPVTKHNFMVTKTEDLADTIRQAFRIAKSGRPGPVLVDIPKDVQINTAEYEPVPVVEPFELKTASEDAIEAAAAMIAQSKKPYIYCGGGVISAGAEKELALLAEKMDAPVGCSMMGLTALPVSNKRNLGMTGMHGHFVASKAKNDADLVITLGARFSNRATGNVAKFCQGAKMIHIDIDAAELDKNVIVDLGIQGDVKDAIARIIEKIAPASHPDWWKEIEEIKKFEAENTAPQIGSLTPYDVIETVNSYLPDDTPVATDVGQHQMWTAQKYRFETPRTFLTSGGLGTMGFGMGAAIGGCVATGKRTVLFTGDGSFGMNLNEMTTAVSQNLPLIVVILNNGVLGMVRQWQAAFYNQHYSQTTLERKTDFPALARAFGAKGFAVTNVDELHAAMKEAVGTNGTVLIDCAIDMDERVLPMIPPGGAIENMILS